jgi:colicin import membrane protein
MVQASTPADGWLYDNWQANLTRRLGQAVALSLALHLGLLIVVAFVRWPQQGERPLASIEISLASLPQPPTKAIEPPKAQQKVVEPPKVQQKIVEAPKPAPVKSAPLPAPVLVPRTTPTPTPLPGPVPVPKAAPIPTPSPTPVKPSNDVLHDVMKGVELPPDAPKFGDYSPAEKPKKSQIKLPDIPVVSQTKDSPAMAPEVKRRSSLTEDVSREVDEEFKKIRTLELPKTPPVEVPVQPSPQPSPQVEAKTPSVKTIDTALKVPGMAPGSNAYLARVRQRISSVWSAPPVDVTRQAYLVIVKFRLHRNGTVSGVMIEQSSGNEYYDLAGKRAVVSAIPLPAFPSDLTEPYFDAHFTFAVGEQG